VASFLNTLPDRLASPDRLEHDIAYQTIAMLALPIELTAKIQALQHSLQNIEELNDRPDRKGARRLELVRRLFSSRAMLMALGFFGYAAWKIAELQRIANGPGLAKWDLLLLVSLETVLAIALVRLLTLENRNHRSYRRRR
jgi:hypothetical protein